MPSTRAAADAEDRAFETRVGRFKFTQFDSKSDEWRYYIQRFELELRIQALDGDEEEVKRARRDLLLKWVGPEVYRLIVDHFDPTPASDKEYADIKKFLDEYYKPTTNYLAERMKFGQCTRKADQTVSQYLNELRSRAVTCKFGGQLDERLRDQFLLGVNNPSMQEELFRRHPEDNASLSDIEKDALIVEAAQSQRKTVENSGHAQIQAISHSARRSKPWTERSHSSGRIYLDPEKDCIRCGADKHPTDVTCPAAKNTCRACGKKGHWPDVCFKGGNVTVMNGGKNPRAHKINTIILEGHGTNFEGIDLDVYDGKIW